ncbi:MAG: 3-keto-disaccharide hydrolase [Bacteroidales bacterium]
MKKKLLIYMLLLTFFPILAQNSQGWENLFNNYDLDGWIQKGGKAKYTVVDGVIIGETVPDSPNSFLCTVKEYSDFILELELFVDTSMNSGIQIRSLSIPEYRKGVVHGYQVEIDPSKRGWSGGIYDEQARGWLYTMESNTEAKPAFKNGQWNKYRIEAIGNSIKTWVNDIPAADIIDDAVGSGFIALQVHSIKASEKPWTLGTQVKWKNIRILTKNLAKNRKKETKEIVQFNFIPNTISDYEKKNGWKLLFDGKSTKGWRGVYKEAFPEKGWEVKDGELVVLPSGGAESANGGDIVSIDEFSDFELVADFKITEGANSGIKYYVTEKENNQGSAIGPEYQILDDKNHPDAKLGRDGNRTMSSLYDLITAKNKRVNPIGEWNSARIVSKNNHVEHWLNGMKVLEYERGSKEFRELVAASKYKVWPGFGEAAKGRILLQDHGNKVSFRSLKIREL